MHHETFEICVSIFYLQAVTVPFRGLGAENYQQAVTVPTDSYRYKQGVGAKKQIQIVNNKEYSFNEREKLQKLSKIAVISRNWHNSYIYHIVFGDRGSEICFVDNER